MRSTDVVHNVQGLVSQQFLLLADMSDQMARDPGCLQLAELASQAVDFAKSGTPVDRRNIPELPRRDRPDWNTGELGYSRKSGNVYESQRALGDLFRMVDLTDTERKAEKLARREHRARDADAIQRQERYLDNATDTLVRRGPMASIMRHPIAQALHSRLMVYDLDTNAPLPEEATRGMRHLFEFYESQLRYVCASANISTNPLTEEEVMVGTITAKTSQPRFRKTMQARLRAHTEDLLRSVRQQLAGPDAEGDVLLHRLSRAWTAWVIAVIKDHAFGAKTFSMIALYAIFETLEALDESREAA